MTTFIGKGVRLMSTAAALTATMAFAQMPVPALDDAQARPQAASAEHQLERLLRCEAGAGKLATQQAAVLFKSLGFTQKPGEFVAPKGKNIQLFGESVVNADTGNGVGVILKTRKEHELAKRLGFRKSDLDTSGEVAFYAKDMGNVRFTVTGKTSTGSGAVGTEVRCHWN